MKNTAYNHIDPKTKYTFRRMDARVSSPDERILICPECGETLFQADIEAFTKCPFCDYKFEFNSELEDFILEPLVGHWMRQHSIFAVTRPDAEEGVSIDL